MRRLNDLTTRVDSNAFACWKIFLKAGWSEYRWLLYIRKRGEWSFVVFTLSYSNRFLLLDSGDVLFHTNDQYFSDVRVCSGEIWDLFVCFVSIHRSFLFTGTQSWLFHRIVNPNQSQRPATVRDWVELIMGMTERFDHSMSCYQWRRSELSCCSPLNDY